LDCFACTHEKLLKEQLGNFPIKGKTYQAKARKAGLHKERFLADITNQIVNGLDQDYKKAFKTKFSTQAKKHVPSLQTEKVDMKKFAKDIVKDCESQFRETDLDR